MTELEARVMREHVAYWTDLANRGIAVAFGPVADPNGGWGIGILEVESESDLLILNENDPAIKSGIGCKFESFLMPRIVLGKRFVVS
jgi:uncharacterized protein YciI